MVAVLVCCDERFDLGQGQHPLPSPRTILRRRHGHVRNKPNVLVLTHMPVALYRAKKLESPSALLHVGRQGVRRQKLGLGREANHSEEVYEPRTWHDVRRQVKTNWQLARSRLDMENGGPARGVCANSRPRKDAHCSYACLDCQPCEPAPALRLPAPAPAAL
jgi:hypothetical protein